MSAAAAAPGAPGAAPFGGTLRVACVQLNTGPDKAAAVSAACDLVAEAAAAGARLVVLPETWAFKGHRAGILASAETADGPSNAALAQLAARLGIFVLTGSHYEPSPVPDRVFNTSLLFGPRGELLATYRKIHLFDAVSGDKVYRESDYLTPGDEVVTVTLPADVDGAAGGGGAAGGDGCASGAGAPAVTLGLTICYDLRFPELYRTLALRGAQVLCVPAAFTAFTGAAHWEVLLRARAIENGCFVVAADQVGEHLPGRDCHGHSMIVDPWGEVLAEVDQGTGFCVADLDFSRLAEVRAQIPSLTNRRPQTYGV